MRSRVEIFASAGELSGDSMLAAILSELSKRIPNPVYWGLGGERSRAAGLQTLCPLTALAVNGVLDVLRSAPRLVAIYLRARRQLQKHPPDLLLLVDYPGMNLRFMKWAKQQSLFVYYVAPPQAWAYRRPEIKTHHFDGIFVHVLFPMEVPFYQAAGAARVVQGHFFDLDSPPLSHRNTVAHDPWIGLATGSRIGVLRRNLPRMLAFWQRVAYGDFPDLDRDLGASQLKPLRFKVLAPVDCLDIARLISRRYDLCVDVLCDEKEFLIGGGLWILFPGTFTLKPALLGLPAVVLGVVDWPTWIAARRILAVSQVALPNILSGEEMYPEAVGPWSRTLIRAWEAAIRRALAQGGLGNSQNKALRASMGTGEGARLGAGICCNLLEAHRM